VNAVTPRWTRAVGWVGLASIPVAFAVAVLFGKETLFMLGPACTFEAATGIVCPTCGSTRALAALAEGRILDALRYNPAVALVLGAALWACWRLVRGTPSKLPMSLPTFAVLVVAIWVANIVSHHVIGVP
jgi:hypothetical protein